MGIKTHLCNTMNPLFKRFGYTIVKNESLYEWQKDPQALLGYNESQLPEEARSYLTPSNPRLKELRTRYSNFDKKVTDPFVWTDNIITPNEMLYFRGETYLWQLMGLNMNAFSYALTTYYVKSIDQLGLLESLKEDDLFGIHTFSIDNKLVSRDLLDSIIEIYFIEKHLNISSSKNFNILDIGAGYGRLAHRTLNALPNIDQYLCTDAFPVSSFLCEYYLRTRKLEGKARVVPLDEVEQTLQNKLIDLAVNIHSFSECKISAIEWWLSSLAKNKVKYLMIVPNSPELRTNDGTNFGNIIEKYNYRLIAKEPKYRDSIVQQYGLNPANHYLFQLR